jgi:polynuc_phos: polyribonucleotide nucleotidyltransferase
LVNLHRRLSRCRSILRRSVMLLDREARRSMRSSSRLVWRLILQMTEQYLSAEQMPRAWKKHRSWFTSLLQIMKQDRFWKDMLSVSKNLEHLLSLHREKKEWFTFPRFPKSV